MKRIAARLLVTAWLAWVIVETAIEFHANRSADYYSSHPGRLLHILAILATGGILALLFYYSSPAGQRSAWRFSLWTLFLVATAIAVVLAVVQILMM
jgi:hypothetical protein